MTDYGVETQNVFDLLGDDDAPAPNPKQLSKKQPSVEAPADAAAPAAGRGGRGGAAGRGGRGGNRGRGGRGGRGGPRGGGFGNRPPKRDGFERHSGTGRGKEVRKGGAGKYGWGSDNQEANPDAAAAVAPTGDAAAAPVPADGAAAAPVAEDAAAQAAPEEPQEEEDNTLSWEEYQRKLEAKRVAEDRSLQAREVSNDDDKKFKAAVKFSKTETDVLYEDVAVQRDSDSGKRKSEKKKKAIISLDEFVKPVGGDNNGAQGAGGQGRGRGRGRGSFRGGDRGGFRGDRGGRGRGGRGGSGPNISDESAFPSLGSK